MHTALSPPLPEHFGDDLVRVGELGIGTEDAVEQILGIEPAFPAWLVKAG